MIAFIDCTGICSGVEPIVNALRGADAGFMSVAAASYHEDLLEVGWTRTP